MIQAIKKAYPILDEKGRPCTFPTFGSQVFGEGEDTRALWQSDKGFYADDSRKLDGLTYQTIVDMIYPIGRTITTFSDSDNPNTLYPWQIWEKTAQGRMIIGTGANEANTDETYGSLAAGTVDRSLGEMGGEAAHGITVEEMPRHLHDAIYANGDGGYEITYGSGTSVSTNAGVLMLTTSETGGYHIKTSFNGGSQPHNNMPPYITANIWKRVG